MHFQTIASRIGSKWLMLAAVLFTVAAGFEIQARFQSATCNREISTEFVTDPLGGSVVVDYEFSAEHRTLKGLWVFFDISPGAPREAKVCLSLRRASDDNPFWSQSFEFKPWRLGIDTQLCRVEGLTLTKGDRYVLRYSMPNIHDGGGWPLRYVKMENAATSIKWGPKIRNSYQPSMLWMEAEPHYPMILMITCAVLLGVCSIAAGKNTAAPALLVMMSSCILLGVYHWQVNIWNFCGTYWPDEYPALSHELYGFFTGQISSKDCLACFDQDRNGQAFFVPLVMAGFQLMGLSIKGSYLATNALFFGAAVALLFNLLRLKGIKGDRPAIALGLLFFSHRCFINSVGELQTDLGGVTATILFIYTLLRAFSTEDSHARLGWYLACGVVAFLGCTIRVALLPLLLVPVCLFLWSLICERKRTWRERAAYLLPALTGGTLLWLCWGSLGLLGTVDKALEFSKKFNHFFSWSGFVTNTFQDMLPGLLIIILLRRRLFYDREFTVVVGSATGLLAMLAYGHLPIWVRYWSPAAALGVILFVWALKEWPKRDRALLAVAWVGALVNFYLNF